MFADGEVLLRQKSVMEKESLYFLSAYALFETKHVCQTNAFCVLFASLVSHMLDVLSLQRRPAWQSRVCAVASRVHKALFTFHVVCIAADPK